MYRNNGIPKLKNYAEALARWESTKPIKGREKDTRPLGYRHRVNEYQIAKKDDGSIVCILWGRSEVVEFKPDGRIGIYEPDYLSTSVANYINDILPSQVRAYIFDFSLVVRAGDWKEQRIERYSGRAGDSPEIVYLDGNYHFLDYKPDVCAKINRKVLNAYFDRHKPFTDYMAQYIKLCGNDFNMKELAGYPYDLSAMFRTWGFRDEMFDSAIEFFNFINDEGEDKFDGYRKAMLRLADATYGGYDYQTHTKRVKYETLIAVFKDMLTGFYAKKIFKFEERTDGLVKRRIHRRYTNNKWAEIWQRLGLV